MIRLLPHPLPTSPVSKLSLIFSLVCRQWSLLMGKRGVGFGGGAK
jgi:hypothetical protein